MAHGTTITGRLLKNEFPMAHGTTISVRVLILRNPTLNVPRPLQMNRSCPFIKKQKLYRVLLKPGKDLEGGCSWDSGPCLGQGPCSQSLP